MKKILFLSLLISFLFAQGSVKIIGLDSDGNPSSLKMTKEGAILTEDGLSIAQGEIAKHSAIYKFGFNSTVGTSEEVIWDGGNGYSGFLTTDSNVTVVSTSVDDADQGTGAWNVIVFGVDSDFNEVVDTLTLNGTTPVVSTVEFRRVFRAYVLHAGDLSPTGGVNAGTLTIASQVSGTPTMAQILPNNGQTLMAIYTVPNGYTGYITNADANVGSGKDATVRLKSRTFGANKPFLNKATRLLFENSFTRVYNVYRPIPAKTDIIMTAFTSTGTVGVSASFEIILVRD